MPRRPDAARVPRGTARLSREAIVAAGIALADAEGLEALSMRRLGQELGANPMSLYHHVRDKDALLDAMLDAVVAGIDPDGAGARARGGDPAGAGAVDADRVDGADGRPGEPDGPWTERLRALVLAARREVVRHPWAARVLAERDVPTPATLRHIDRVLGILRGGGCSVDLAHHALHLLGSRVLGFSQDLFDDSASTRAAPEQVAAQAAAWAATMPHVAELALAARHDGPLGGCDDDAEFAFALDVLLDGLERRRAAAAPPGTGPQR